MAEGNWKFASGDGDVLNVMSESVQRDADRELFYAPLMYPAGPSAKGAIKNKDFGKGASIIRVNTEFESQDKRGLSLVINNIAAVNGQPVIGDSKAIDQKTELARYSMTLGYQAFRIPPIRSNGKLNDKRSTMNFRDEAMQAAPSWARRTTEGLILAHLYGIAAPTNTAVLTELNLPSSLSTVAGNAICEFDSTHLAHAGSGNTTDALVGADTSAVLTASLLDVTQTSINDLTIPIEKVDLGDGSQGYLCPINGRGIEQLKNDPDYREAVAEYRGPLNALLKRQLVKYGNFLFYEEPHALLPYANVGRLLILGKGALQFAPVMGWEWWEGVEDTHDWFNLISIGSMFGCRATYFNSTRRNAYAVDYYQRT